MLRESRFLKEFYDNYFSYSDVGRHRLDALKSWMENECWMRNKDGVSVPCNLNSLQKFKDSENALGHSIDEESKMYEGNAYGFPYADRNELVSIVNGNSYANLRNFLEKRVEKPGDKTNKEMKDERFPEENVSDNEINIFRRLSKSMNYKKHFEADGNLAYKSSFFRPTLEPSVDLTSELMERFDRLRANFPEKDLRDKKAFNDVGDVCIEVYCNKYPRGTMNYLGCIRDNRCFG